MRPQSGDAPVTHYAGDTARGWSLFLCRLFVDLLIWLAIVLFLLLLTGLGAPMRLVMGALVNHFGLMGETVTQDGVRVIVYPQWAYVVAASVVVLVPMLILAAITGLVRRAIHRQRFRKWERPPDSGRGGK